MKKGIILASAALALVNAAGAGYAYEGQWGTEGSGNGQFRDPTGVAVAPSGNVYVSDEYNDRIQYFTSTGSFLGKWGSRGTGPGQFYQPWGVAVGPTGLVYVVGWRNHRIQ